MLCNDREINKYTTALLCNRFKNTNVFPWKQLDIREDRCFLCSPCRDVTNRTGSEVKSLSVVEAGSSASTVALRVVGSDENGSLEYETVKYGRESHGTRSRE
jgi:hypothetical protein